MPTHSSILVWKIPWTVEPGGLQSMGLQKSRTWLSAHPSPPPPTSHTQRSQAVRNSTQAIVTAGDLQGGDLI